MDSFVSGILEGSPRQLSTSHSIFPNERATERESAESSSSLRANCISSKRFSPEVSAGFGVPQVAEGTENQARVEEHARRSTKSLQSLFGYALIFINFTFVVASMLLIMSGIIARGNQAVKLCAACGRITLVALIFGLILWLFSIFGFLWIRQRQMVFLLVYVGFLVVLFFVLLGLIIAAAVYDRDSQVSLMDPTYFLEAWERGVNDTHLGRAYGICSLQERFNCSGFSQGCCVAGPCYNASEPPAWVERVCPTCPNFPPMAPVVCTGTVYSIVQKNLSGFLVIIVFAMILVVTGILFAFLSRRANQLMMNNVRS